MEDQKKLIYAREAYDTLCTCLDNIGWHYKKFEDELKIMFGVGGDVVKPNSRAHEHLFNLRYFLNIEQKLGIFGVVNL